MILDLPSWWGKHSEVNAVLEFFGSDKRVGFQESSPRSGDLSYSFWFGSEKNEWGEIKKHKFCPSCGKDLLAYLLSL